LGWWGPKEQSQTEKVERWASAWKRRMKGKSGNIKDPLPSSPGRREIKSRPNRGGKRLSEESGFWFRRNLGESPNIKPSRQGEHPGYISNHDTSVGGSSKKPTPDTHNTNSRWGKRALTWVILFFEPPST